MTSSCRAHRMGIVIGLVLLASVRGGLEAAGSQEGEEDSPRAAHTECKLDDLSRSLCMIELILQDVRSGYDQLGGGGVSSIQAESSTSYTIALPQEERIDRLTYVFEVDADGTVRIQSRTPSTTSF